MASVIDRVEDLVTAVGAITTKASEQLGANTALVGELRPVLEEVKGILKELRDEKKRENDLKNFLLKPFVSAITSRPIVVAVAGGITLFFTLIAGYLAGRWGVALPLH